MAGERENRECDTVDFGLDSQMKVHMYGLDPKSRHAGKRCSGHLAEKTYIYCQQSQKPQSENY